MPPPEHLGQPPAERLAKLLGRGVCLASLHTIYRVLAEPEESKEPKSPQLRQPHVKPSIGATAPHQVWTWDITQLATLERGDHLHARRPLATEPRPAHLPGPPVALALVCSSTMDTRELLAEIMTDPPS